MLLVTSAWLRAMPAGMENVILRGRTYYARYRVPEARWADVGQALGAAGGTKREVVRTLATTDAKEARSRRHGALAAILAELDAALRQPGKQPLSADWTADGGWLNRAVEHRVSLETRGDEVNGYYAQAPGDDAPPEPVLNADLAREGIEADADHVAARRGPEVARQFLDVALGEGLTVAEGRRRWLAELDGARRAKSIKGHEAALAKLEAYLKEHKGWPSLEGVGVGQITRRLAGEYLTHCATLTSPATVKREASAYNGLWRWAVRRGYAEMNPWSDQTTGLSARRGVPGTAVQVEKRGYTIAELTSLLRAGAAELAPNRGGYGTAFWDLIRLLLLTGARPGELLGLRVRDVLAGGAAVALAAGEGAGKTKNAKRIMPLHDYARAVIEVRLASLPDVSPGASLWPEVPVLGADGDRTKTVATRFVAVRRRLLPGAEGVDLYSLRRSFLTAAETAKNAGGRLDDGMIARLAGHGQGHLALDVYSDWSRLGSPQLSGELLPKLARLRAAVEDVVHLGYGEVISLALAETVNQRPPVRRTAPAFSRVKER